MLCGQTTLSVSDNLVLHRQHGHHSPHSVQFLSSPESNEAKHMNILSVSWNICVFAYVYCLLRISICERSKIDSIHSKRLKIVNCEMFPYIRCTVRQELCVCEYMYMFNICKPLFGLNTNGGKSIVLWFVQCVVAYYHCLSGWAIWGWFRS